MKSSLKTTDDFKDIRKDLETTGILTTEDIFSLFESKQKRLISFMIW